MLRREHYWLSCRIRDPIKMDKIRIVKTINFERFISSVEDVQIHLKTNRAVRLQIKRFALCNCGQLGCSRTMI